MPEISPVLSARGIRPRRGQVMMIAGPPNSGKSMIALHYVVQHNLPSLYVSADTDETTTLYRSLAMLTGDTVDNIENTYESGGGSVYAEDLAKLSNVRFSFDPTPTVNDVATAVLAYEELFGRPPFLVVIDNLLNIYSEGESGTGSWGGMVEVSQFLHHLARKSGGAVWILHHTSESEGKPQYPASRKAILNKVSHLPEMILTVALDKDRYHVACVKNRSGPHDATGHDYASLYAMPERMQLFDTFEQFNTARAWASYT